MLTLRIRRFCTSASYVYAAWLHAAVWRVATSSSLSPSLCLRCGTSNGNCKEMKMA